MSLGQWILNQKRLFITITILLTILGLASLSAIPKDEDPRLPDWFASIVVILPGGDVEQIDEMIAKPLNNKLKEIDEIKKVETTTRMNVTSLQLEMKDSVKNTKDVWDKVRRVIDEVKTDFPNGTQEPNFLENTNQLETILYVITGDSDLLALKDTATAFKQFLLTVPGTSKVVIHGDPHEEIQSEFSYSKLENVSISHARIAQKISQANTGLPAGFVELDGKAIPLIIPSRISNPDQVSRLKILKGSGDPIELKDISHVKKTEKRFENRAYWNSKPAVFVGVIAQNPIEIVKFGNRIRSEVENFRKKELPANSFISEVSFNPDRTEERLKDLGMNLLIGILTVGLILWIWMGWKVSLVVSLFVPTISLVGFFVYSASGSVLHQISLAAFVISLGQFIDNIIVIVEWMDSKIKLGTRPLDAAVEAIDAFKKPMFFATGTNISAFIPMLASTGTTAAFTFSIPLVSIITMIAAWILALFVVPVFTGYLFLYFKESKNFEKMGMPSKSTKLLSQFSLAVATKPVLLTSISFLIMLFSSIGFIFVKKQFFPSADRNQFTIKLETAEGTSAKETDKQLQQMMTFLKTKQEVIGTAGFVGEQIPRFYYNVGLGQWGSNIAELIVITKEKSLNNQLIKDIHNFAAEHLKPTFVLARNLEQGPPVPAPIEYKLFSEDSKKLNQATDELQKRFISKSKTVIVKNDLGSPTERLSLKMNQDLSERFDLSEDQLALALLSSTSGLTVTKYFENGETKNIRLVGPEIKSMDQLYNLPIRSSNFRNLKLKDLATITKENSPAVIHRVDGQKVARVFGWPTDGTSAQQFAEEMKNEVKSVQDKSNLKVTLGGEVQESGAANMAILQSIPLGIFILMICLLLEFNSIRKMFIILLSVPFVIAGVTPGLLLGNAAFGFMSLLGVLALVGIVVNNSILLIESIDEFRDQNFSIQDSIVNALQTRTRPILLTAITTIAGLLPMAFEESTLWPPLAWAMISGLIGSTIITLILVPSLYSLCFREFEVNYKSIQLPNIATLLIAFIVVFPFSKSNAKIYDLQLALQEVKSQAPQVLAAKAESKKIEALSLAQQRGAFMPKLGLQVEGKKIHTQLTQKTGFGSFDYGKTDQILGGIELTQPIFNLKEMSGEREKMDHLSQSQKAQERVAVQESTRQTLQLLIQYQKMKLTASSLKNLELSLMGIEKEINKFVELGLRGQGDLLNVQLALSENQSQQIKVRATQETLKKTIQIYLPDFEDLQSGIRFFAENNQAISGQRPEIDALDLYISSQHSELTSLRQGYWPTLELKGRYNYADQGLLDQKNWLEAAVVLKWNLFEGGSRSALNTAQFQEIVKTQKSKQALLARLEAEKLNNKGEIEEVQFRLAAAESNVTKAKKARDEDRRNSKAGRVPLKDWLSSEIRFEEKKLELETLRLDKIKLQYDDLYVKGISLS